MAPEIVGSLIASGVLGLGWLTNKIIGLWWSRYKKGQEDAGIETRLKWVEDTCAPIPEMHTSVKNMNATLHNGLEDRTTRIEDAIKTMENARRRNFATLRGDIKSITKHCEARERMYPTKENI